MSIGEEDNKNYMGNWLGAKDIKAPVVGLIGAEIIMHCLVIDSGVYPVGQEFKHSW